MKKTDIFKGRFYCQNPEGKPIRVIASVNITEDLPKDRLRKSEMHLQFADMGGRRYVSLCEGNTLTMVPLPVDAVKTGVFQTSGKPAFPKDFQTTTLPAIGLDVPTYQQIVGRALDLIDAPSKNL